MIKQTIKDSLVRIYQSLDKVSLPHRGDNWVRQDIFEKAALSKHINFKNIGYTWFNELLKDAEAFMFRKEQNVWYVKRQRQHVKQEDIDKVKRRLRLSDDNEFIGQFEPQEMEGEYRITDIRNTDFSKIEDKDRGIKDPYILFKSRNKAFHRCAYYKFTWKLLKLEPIQFGIDLQKDIVPVYPKDIVQCLYEGIMGYPVGAAKKIARSLDTLKKQLTQSGKEIFIYELLQNANDYPWYDKVDGEEKILPVEVVFHISKKYLIFQHTGDCFNAKNIAAICDINDGEKADNTKAIGYKGIGFKTVFLDNDYVLLKTGEYTFRFDKSATDVVDNPWQLLPIWTAPHEIDNDIKSVFSRYSDEKFRVKFALQPRDLEILTNRNREDNYIDLFANVFDSERVILFIPNIQKVSIFIDGQQEVIVREKDNKDWCVSDPLVDYIPEDIKQKINDVLNDPNSLRSNGYEKIPEKYLNFSKTSVTFACKKDGRQLKAVDDAVLYCYLPVKRADWGFHFLMNTDMVPNGQRDDIEDIELNHVIARIAGRQFFYWIKQLISSEAYESESIFMLIPDFKECKRRRIYKTFIEEFQEEFESLIKKEPFIPSTDKKGNRSFKCIDEIINDTTGMTANGIMSDEDFIHLMRLNNSWLPIKELRKSTTFGDFLRRYAPKELKVSVNDVVSKCDAMDFQQWLGNPQNNTRFIKHWLQERKLQSFVFKPIFMEHKGDLFTAGKLYYDFDTNCREIAFLREFVPHLCDTSRTNLEAEETWRAFADKYFASFRAAYMLTTYILPEVEAVALLYELDNSKAFYRYLAAHKVDLGEHSQEIPYFTEQGVVSMDYDNYLYFYNEDVQRLTQEPWLGANTINVLSRIYFDGLDGETKDRLASLFAKLGFHEFDTALFITEVIAGDIDFRAEVNAVIEDFSTNKAFVDYVFNEGVALKDYSFKNYVLSCVDIHNNEIYLTNDDVRYFNQGAFAQNSSYEENISHAWLQADMMYALSNDYFEGREKEEIKKLESFLRQQFGIKTFTDKSFFTDVVIKNKALIYASLVDEATMRPFLAYLKRDAERLFDGSTSFNEIKDMPLLSYDGTVVSRASGIQYIAYNEEAKSLCEKAWCPKTFIVLSQQYTNDFSHNTRHLFQIEKFDINAIMDIITMPNSSLHQSINVAEHNLDFWRWIKTKQEQIASFDRFKVLPLLDQNRTNATPASLYISDSYQKESIESLVKKYAKDARFVSPLYIETNSEQAEWITLFKKLGLKSDNKDILLSDVLPNLKSLEVASLDSVVAMMTKHLSHLKDAWKEIKSQIIQLRVRTRSGEYKSLDQAIIISVDENTVSEPFAYMPLPNEVHADILKNNKELLLLIAKEYGKRNLITKKQQWIEAKLKEYLDRFAADEQGIADIHIQFVREIAKIQIQTEYKIDSALRKQIKYLAKSEGKVYKYAQELTFGSEYSPACDFEANGVTELPYLSNAYIFEGNKDFIKSYFKSEGVRQNMMQEDLKFLAHRSFACYFWSHCFLRRLKEYKTWIRKGYFHNLVCIPTETSVQQPELLYLPSTAEYAIRAKVPQWEEKVPWKSLVDAINEGSAQDEFAQLNFRRELSFEDCLYYLAVVSHSREKEMRCRRMVLGWMLSSQNKDESLVDNYRKSPHALWRNGKGDKKHIIELYAIHPSATQERSIFSGDEFVIQASAFPESADAFVQACAMLKIKCLTHADFVATPIETRDETKEMMAFLQPRLLILAAIESSDKFQECYERYKNKLRQYHFVVCEKIDLGYDTIHNDAERIYHDESHLYYVGAWNHKRTFTKFCERLQRLIGFKVNDNVCEDVLDSSNTEEECINKYCHARVYDKKFQTYLQELGMAIPVESEEEDTRIDTDYYNETTTPPSFHTPFTNYGTDSNDHKNAIDQDINDPPIEEQPHIASVLQQPKPYTQNEIARMRSHGTPLELESLPPTKEEIELLAQCNIKPEEIADTNYLVKLRLFQSLKEQSEEPEETMEAFVRSTDAVHQLKGDRYIHICSAVRGVMYISPSVWNKMLDDKWRICVYLDGQGKNFHYIENVAAFLKLVEKDDIVIKITGKEKVAVVKALYTGLLEGAKSTAYTLIRVAARTNMDAVFARYIGPMAEAEDGQDNLDDY